MVTAHSIIEQAYMDIGVFTNGRPLSASDISTGLFRLNAFVAELSADAIVPARGEVTYPLTAGLAEHSFGSDLAGEGPTAIDVMFIRSSDEDYRLTPMDARQYAQLSGKLAAGRPSRYLRRGRDSLVFYRTPDRAYTLHIIGAYPLSQLTGHADEIQVPAEYNTLLYTNLAVMLAPAFGKSAKPETVRLANRSKQTVQTQTQEHVSLELEFLGGDSLRRRSSADFDGGYSY